MNRWTLLTAPLALAGEMAGAASPCVPFERIDLTIGKAPPGLRVGTSVAVHAGRGALGSLDGVYLLTDLGAGTWLSSPRMRSPQTQSDALFGVSVGVSAGTMVVGASHDDGGAVNAGAVYTLDLTGGSPPVFRRLLSEAPLPGAWFGRSVAVSGGTIAVGAPRDDRAGYGAGAVSVFERIAGDWVLVQTILPPTPSGLQGFGTSVAIDGDTLVVGSPGDDTVGLNAGALFVYERHGAGWGFSQRLVSGDAGAGDSLGQSVDLDGDRLAAGAWGEDEAGANAGAVYVFERAGSGWAQQAKLVSARGGAGDMLGASVALSGGALVAGAVRADGSIPDSGAAIVFRRTGEAWVEVASVEGGGSDTYTGAAVGLDGGVMLVGAPLDDAGGPDSGLVLGFDLGRLACPADFNLDCLLDVHDAAAFLSAFGAGSAWADGATPVGVLDFADVVAFLSDFALGCP